MNIDETGIDGMHDIDIDDLALGDIEYDDGLRPLMSAAMLDWDAGLDRASETSGLPLSRKPVRKSLQNAPTDPATEAAVESERPRRWLGLVAILAAVAALAIVVFVGVRVISDSSPNISGAPPPPTESPMPLPQEPRAGGDPNSDWIGRIVQPAEDGPVNSPLTVSGTVAFAGSTNVWVLVSPATVELGPSASNPGRTLIGPLELSVADARGRGRWVTKVRLGTNCEDERRRFQIALFESALEKPSGGLPQGRLSGPANDEAISDVVRDASVLATRNVILDEFTDGVDTDLPCWSDR